MTETVTKIEKARKALGWSRAEMSRQLEIPYRTIENWEKGNNSAAPWLEKLLVEKLESLKD